MDPMMILALVERGISVASMLLTAGKDAAPVLGRLLNITQGAQAGTITDEQLAAEQAFLDSQIEEFNAPFA